MLKLDHQIAGNPRVVITGAGHGINMTGHVFVAYVGLRFAGQVLFGRNPICRFWSYTHTLNYPAWFAPFKAAWARAFAVSALRAISSGDGRLINTSGGMSAFCINFTRHFWRSCKALFESRSLENRDLARSLRSRSI